MFKKGIDRAIRQGYTEEVNRMVQGGRLNIWGVFK